METPHIEHAMRLAIEAAYRFEGSTAPNPPVGAVALNAAGEVLAIAAHERAGTAHAEIVLLDQLTKNQQLQEFDTLAVTLEPCNHRGRTGPCTEALINARNNGAPLRRIIYGCQDPNPRVQGAGAAALSTAGIAVSSGVLKRECQQLIRQFSHWVVSHRPWVTLKKALNEEGEMTPEPGHKTFTSEESLRFAHVLRKRADAILTGSGTVLKDQPLFTVRRVADFNHKKRWLVVMDRKQRLLQSKWAASAENRGFRLHFGTSLEDVLDFLGKQNVLEVLVEAGPTLSDAIERQELWNEKWVIQKGIPDHLQVEYRY